MNPYIKNCRTGFHDDILNRTSHYLKLLNTKSAIVNKQQKNYLFLLKQNQNKEKNQARITDNLKLMNSLVDIQRRFSSYSIETDRHLPRRKATLKSYYEERQKQLSLSKDNLRLYKKLVGIESEISGDKIKKFDEDITRYSKLIKHPYRQITQMDDRLFGTYRHELVRAKLSPAKYRLLTQQFAEKGSEGTKAPIKYRKTHRRKRNFRELDQKGQTSLVNPQLNID